MKNLIIPTAEPFFLPAGKTGCLLIHGFTGAPKEMRLLGNFLHQQGISVLAIRLAGHATNIQDMPRTRWQDWLASVEDGINILSGYCDTIFSAGLSMGGILTLLAASMYPLQGAIAMSTPFTMQNDWRIKIAKPLSTFIPIVKKGESDTRDKETDKDHIDYDGYPTRSIAELTSLIKILHQNLEQISIPVLMINSKSDGSVPVDDQQKYIQRMSKTQPETLILEKSGHVITEDLERELVFKTTLDFIKKYEK